MDKVIDYLTSFDRRLVSPIWGGRKDFDFLCAGHLDFAQALGFELWQPTAQLVQVRPAQVGDETGLEEHLACHPFDEGLIEREVAALPELRAASLDPACQVVAGQPRACGGGCFGPLTVTSDILGVETMLRALRRAPGLVHCLMDCVTSHMERLARTEAEAGADFFWVAEPVASLLAPRQYEEFCGRYLRRVFSCTSLPGFLHTCGKTDHQLKGMLSTGAQVLSIDSVSDMRLCLETVPADVVMMGNVDPALLRMGAPHDAAQATRELLELAQKRPNLVVSSGCAVQEGTPDANVEALIDAALGR